MIATVFFWTVMVVWNGMRYKSKITQKDDCKEIYN